MYCRINAKKYIDLIEDCLIPFIEENHEENIILQQDNTVIYNTKKTQEYRFRSKNLLMK